MKPANPPDASVERARDAVAKAIYAKRPYYLAATQSVVGQASLARRLDWDEAPAFYLSDCLEIAEVARAAHVTALTAQLEAERARALRWKWSIYREVVRFHREDHDALCLSLLNVGNRAEDLTTRLAAVEAERDALREGREWRHISDAAPRNGEPIEIVGIRKDGSILRAIVRWDRVDAAWVIVGEPRKLTATRAMLTKPEFWRPLGPLPATLAPAGGESAT